MPTFDIPALTIPERSRLLARVVAPRPIAFVSTVGSDGVGNLAPFSYFTMGGGNPACLTFCTVNLRDGTEKDSLRNIEATGEFVVNVVTRAMAEQMNRTAVDFHADVDEFDVSGFTRAPSVRVKPPGVAESPVRMECRLIQVVRVGDGASASNFIIGEVRYVSADDAVCTDGLPDNHKLDQLSRLGADLYLPTTPDALFSMKRPSKP